MEIKGCIEGAAAKREHAAAMVKVDERIKKGQKLDASAVPANLQDVIPLAEKWGWYDEDVRERVAEKATPEEKTQLKVVVEKNQQAIKDWVNTEGPKKLTTEMMCFMALCTAAEEVSERKK
jgi:hypothetical protein